MSANQFKVFISWSKEPAKQFAECVHKLLEKIFPDQNVGFFISSKGINPGDRFISVLDANLADSYFGILILTNNNYGQEWLMYEAGALAKGTNSKLVPILFTRETGNREEPIKDFNYIMFNYEDFFKLICEIKKSMHGEINVNQKDILKETFDKEWNNFEQTVKEITQDHQDNYHDTIIRRPTKENVGLLMMDEEAYDEILSKRDSHLEDLIKKLKNDKSERIIIFGGVSTFLRKESSKRELAAWVVKNPKSKLFICHENSEVAKERARDLPPDVYDKSSDKDKETLRRKILAVQEMKDFLLENIVEPLHNNVNFIEITKLSNLYVTIQGDIMHLTPLLHDRSSNTITIKLKDRKYIEEILLYLRSIISDNMVNGHLLVNEIDLILKNRPIDKEGEKKHGK